MNTTSGEGGREFRQRFRDWLSASTPVILPTDPAKRFDALRTWQRCLYEAGWLGWGWPTEYGGRGGTVLDQLTIYQELSRARAPMPAALVGLEVIGPTLARSATATQALRFIPPLLRGDEIWAQGFSEPGAGSDLASISSSAILGPNGFMLRGQKVWASWAHYAQWCAVLARTAVLENAPRHQGISYLLVDLRSPGVTVKPIRQINGENDFAEIFFDDVHVPEENLLGELHGGWSLAMSTLSFERGPAMLRRLSELQAAFDELLIYAATYSESLPSSTVERVGMCRTLLDTMVAQGYAIADRVIRGEQSALDSVDKLFLTETEQALFGLGLDLIGDPTWVDVSESGSGRTWLRDYIFGRAASIYGGTSQIQRNIIADRLLGLPRN